MPVLVAASLAGLSGLVIPENIVAVRPVSHSWSCPTRLRRSRTSATAPSRHAWRMAFPWSPRRTSRPVSRPARHVCRASTARSPTPARRRCSPRRRPCRPPRGPPAACICPTGACSSRPPARESSRAWPAGTPRPASAPGSGLVPGPGELVIFCRRGGSGSRPSAPVKAAELLVSGAGPGPVLVPGYRICQRRATASAAGRVRRRLAGSSRRPCQDPVSPPQSLLSGAPGRGAQPIWQQALPARCAEHWPGPGLAVCPRQRSATWCGRSSHYGRLLVRRAGGATASPGDACPGPPRVAA